LPQPTSPRSGRVFDALTAILGYSPLSSQYRPSKITVLEYRHRLA